MQWHGQGSGTLGLAIVNFEHDSLNSFVPRRPQTRFSRFMVHLRGAMRAAKVAFCVIAASVVLYRIIFTEIDMAEAITSLLSVIAAMN
jgi:hypothetical protein